MKCKICGKQITPFSARHCSTCGSDYCETCAKSSVLCDCYGELGYYS